jgi:hypothetical protein
MPSKGQKTVSSSATGIAPTSCPCASVGDEDETELVIGQLPGLADEEVGRDAPARTLELPFALLDPEDDSPVAEVRIG